MNETYIKSQIDARVKDSFQKKDNYIDYVEKFYYSLGLDEPKSEYCIQKSHIVEFETFFKCKLKKFIPENSHCFMAGGSVLTYILTGNELMIRDYDIFVPNTEEYNTIETHLLSLGGSVTSETKHAKHFSFGYIEIDLVKRPINDIFLLLREFDIDICRVGFDVYRHNFVFHKEVTFQNIFSLTFTLPNLYKMDFKKRGIIQLRRILKYINKGFEIRQKTLLYFYSRTLLAYVVDPKDQLNYSEKIGSMVVDLVDQIGQEYQFEELEYDSEFQNIFGETIVKDHFKEKQEAKQKEEGIISLPWDDIFGTTSVGAPVPPAPKPIVYQPSSF